MSAKLVDEGREIYLSGEIYTHTLACLHLSVAPRNYLEVGVLHGDTLKFARCSAIGIDPEIALDGNFLDGRPNLQVFETTSDEFYASHSPSLLFNSPIHLAFLDGMHQIDYLLRDFINTEKFCDRNSIVMMHDCLPRDPFMTGASDDTSSSRFPGYWTGDVWKIVPILRHWRPDLIVECLDALPTGLVAVTGLDPQNGILSKNYDVIISEWANLSLLTFGLERLIAVGQVKSAKRWRRQFGTQETPLHGSALRRRLGRMMNALVPTPR